VLRVDGQTVDVRQGGNAQYNTLATIMKRKRTKRFQLHSLKIQINAFLVHLVQFMADNFSNNAIL
jgi:hypothetical protein